MKIAFVTQSISRRNGGVSEVARRLGQTLSDLPGTSVEVLALRDESTDADLPAWAPLRPRIVETAGPASLGCAPRAARELRALAPDLVHLHGLWTALSHTTRALGKPYIISPHGMLDPWALANSAWKKHLAGWLYENAAHRRAACFHAMTRAEFACIRARGLRQPVCLIPNGVDLPSPTAAPAPWADRVDAGRPVLLYLGRIHPKKGLPALIEAWHEVRPEGALVIAGWDQGGHEAELRALGGGGIHFVGPLFAEKKAAAYANANGFILPSLSEGLPLVVLEAWSHRLPVLMTPQCNLPEGFAADAAVNIEHNHASIAAGLRDFFSMQKSERIAMGERGRSLVESEFTWPRIAGQMRAVYEWLLGGGAPPACIVH